MCGRTGWSPPREVICDMDTKQFWYTLEVRESAVLCWPLVGRPGRQFTFDLEAKTLWWMVCMRVEQWRVIPTMVCSPLRLKAEAHLANGLWMQMDGQPMTLREFAASRAFAHVPEKVRASLHRQLPVHDDAASYTPNDVKLALMRNANPDMSVMMAEEAVRVALLDEKKIDDKLDLSDLDFMIDCAIKGDIGAFIDDAEKTSKKKQALAAELTEVTKSVAKHFASHPPSAKAKTHDKSLQNELTKGKKAIASRQRWFAPADGNLGALIDMCCPPLAKCTIDSKNGRYFCVYRGSQRKSFSWTERGHGVAATMVLNWLWGQHTAATGQECPIPKDWLQI